MPHAYRSVQDAADATGRLLAQAAPPLPDLADARAIPARALATMTAKDIATRILFPAKKPTLAHEEWIPTLATEGLAADFPRRNLWLEHPVPASDDWRIVGHIQGAASWDWGVTFLSCGYHDYSAETDVDFMVRLGGLMMSLAWDLRRKRRGQLRFAPSPWQIERSLRAVREAGLEADEDDLRACLSWEWAADERMGAVLARVVDSREYATRVEHLVMTERLAEEYLAYYMGKAEAVALAVDNEAPEVALEWDRRFPRDTVSGYVFANLEEPTAHEEALLSMKLDAMRREKAAARDAGRANAEVGHAFYRGVLRPLRYRLPGTGMIASVAPPRAGTKVPYVRYTRDPQAE